VALSDRIKQRREEKKITATELARLAQVSKGFVSEIESGQAPRPSGSVLYRLATALGTTVADLLEQEVRPISREIPVTLQQFAEGANLPIEDVKMLAQIRFRGEQPNTVEDWQYLYQSIKHSVTKGS
jgi:transcriptional regulator with XRE-family HTH domain